jgi:CheY-like chemotaxis protein
MALILVVEDELAYQELITRFLKREGHVVVLAADGETGVNGSCKRLEQLLAAPRTDPCVLNKVLWNELADSRRGAFQRLDFLDHQFQFLILGVEVRRDADAGARPVVH